MTIGCEIKALVLWKFDNNNRKNKHKNKNKNKHNKNNVGNAWGPVKGSEKERKY